MSKAIEAGRPASHDTVKFQCRNEKTPDWLAFSVVGHGNMPTTFSVMST